MKLFWVVPIAFLSSVPSFADDAQSPAAATPAPAAPSASAAPEDAPIRLIEPGPADTAAATPGEAAATAKFASDAKWEIAGYNNEEIVYSILVTNQDTRILHCSAELHGFYFENGEKRSISDRQSTTVFPGKQVNVGHWMGMDQKSGATYKVSCRAQ